MDVELTEWDLRKYARLFLSVGFVLAVAANVLRTFREGLEGRIEYAVSDHEHHRHENADEEVDDAS